MYLPCSVGCDSFAEIHNPVEFIDGILVEKTFVGLCSVIMCKNNSDLKENVSL